MRSIGVANRVDNDEMWIGTDVCRMGVVTFYHVGGNSTINRPKAFGRHIATILVMPNNAAYVVVDVVCLCWRIYTEIVYGIINE